MSVPDDTVKVRVASTLATPNGVVLSLSTLDGPKVQFLLDDIATAMLQLTLASALEQRLAVTETDKDKHIVFTNKDKA